MKGFHYLVWIFVLIVPCFAQSNAVPFVKQPLVPSAAQPGGADFVLTINGAGFAPSAIVQWNGNPRLTTFISPTQLMADIPAADITKAGSASVAVINPAPGGGRSNPLPFTITKPLPPYFSRTSIDFYRRARSVAAVDFNNDGLPDLAAAARSCEMALFMNNGDGTFGGVTGAQGFCPDGTAAVSPIVIGDFDNNGNLDAAATVGWSLLEFLGDGKGGFSFRTQPTGTTWALADADFDSDGILDLAVGLKNRWESHVVLLGNGDGSFRTGPWWYGGRKPMSLVPGDFNGDGRLDLAEIPDPDLNQVCTLLGNKDATFSPGPCIPVGAGPRSLGSADFNGDGISDLVVANHDSGSVWGLLGKGDGTFQASYEYQGPEKFSPTSIAIGDLDGDGKLDLAIASRGAGKITLLFGNGDGTFIANPGEDPSVACEESVVIADFNGDGRPDLATAGNDKLYVLFQSPLIHLPRSFHYPGVELYQEWWDIFEMDNMGSTDVQITNFQLVGSDADSFYLDGICHGTLAPGKTCWTSVWFIPRRTGHIHAVLRVEYQAPGMKSQRRDTDLWGRGKAARDPD